jgi:hypothetical protein
LVYKLILDSEEIEILGNLDIFVGMDVRYDYERIPTSYDFFVGKSI